MINLIIGGTSGLGLEVARFMAAQDNYEHPIVTGRHDPEAIFADYREFDLNTEPLADRIGKFVMELPPIHALVYSAGFYQEGHITDLSDADVDKMFNVGGRGLVFFVKKLLEKQGNLEELITITSTSQWTPREFESVYNFVKAGAGHYSHGQALDPSIGKTRVIGVSGMSTEFWDGTDKDTSKMLPPEWVARQIMGLRKSDKRYRFAKILGATADLPQRVEIVEEW
jgi:NAD(P)-dependent dehydrogenase (short-subunit alcohol dehydrogenase family)